MKIEGASFEPALPDLEYSPTFVCQHLAILISGFWFVFVFDYFLTRILVERTEWLGTCIDHVSARNRREPICRFCTFSVPYRVFPVDFPHAVNTEIFEHVVVYVP